MSYKLYFIFLSLRTLDPAMPSSYFQQIFLLMKDKHFLNPNAKFLFYGDITIPRHFIQLSQHTLYVFNKLHTYLKTNKLHTCGNLALCCAIILMDLMPINGHTFCIK